MLTMRKSGGPWVHFWPVALSLVALAGCEPGGPHLLLEGEKLLQQGNYPAAVEKLQNATTRLTLPSQSAQAWNHLGLALHSAGRPREAEQAYRKALAMDPNLVVVRFNVGCLSLEQNQLAPALDDLRSYTLLRTNAVDGWVKLGTVQWRARQVDAAEKSFQAALRLNPKLPEALNNLGVIQQQRRKTREALLQFAEALKHQPNYPPALLNLAIVSQQHSLGRPYAVEKYREYLELQPRPGNWAAVSEVVRQLEWELRPPPPPALTSGLGTNASSLATRTNNPPARTPTPTNALVGASAVPALPGTNQASITKSNPPPIAKVVAKVEVVPPPAAEPKPKPAPPIPPPTTTATPPVVPPVVSPPVTNTPVPAVVTHVPAPLPDKSVAGSPDAGKPGFFQRINPVNLFRPKPKPVMRTTELNPPPMPEAAEVPAPSVAVSKSPTVASATPRPAYTRYKYELPSRPTPGNRAAAAEKFSEGLEAQRARQWGTAEAAYQAALKLDPAFFEAHYNLGLAALETNNLAQALVAFENALTVEPLSVNARFNFAAVLRRANHPQDAAEELEKLLAVAPEEVRAHFSLANLYAQQLFQKAPAREHYRKVLELEPNHPQSTAIRYWLASNP